ncbi:Ig-like domain-containing protein [Vibrio jasicida]|uniref:Ig-like domain-containing protein n=1 Tax=Vibrio jasicida TaxID=766224 RepID=UPI004069567D
MKIVYKLIALGSLFVVLSLSGCGGDDQGLLDIPNEPKPDVITFRAFPVALTMTKDESSIIELANSVESSTDIPWEIKKVLNEGHNGIVTDISQSSFKYRPLETGIAVLDYEVSNGEQTSKSQVLIAVNDNATENNKPEADNVAVVTDDNTTITIDLKKYIFDPDGDALSVTQVVNASGRFSLSDDGYSLVYTPNGYVGLDQALYSIEDERGGYAIAYVVVTTEDSSPDYDNTPPLAKSYAKNIDSKTLKKWEISLEELGLVSDVDNEEIILTNIFDGNGRAVRSVGNNITYTPGSFVGVDQFTYVVKDAREGFAAGTFTVTVSDSSLNNTPPSATEVIVGPIEYDPLASFEIDVSEYVSDVESDPLRIVTFSGAEGVVAIDSEQPLIFNYTPPASLSGKVDDFAYVVSDGRGGFGMSTIKVQFKTKVNAPPIVTTAKVDIKSNENVTINLDDYISDADNSLDELVISDLSSATKPGQAILSGHKVVYEANEFNGVDLLTYLVRDGQNTVQGNIVISVGETNHKFVAHDFTVEIDAGTDLNEIDWYSNVEIEGSADNIVTIESVLANTLGQAEIIENELFYTPNKGQYGEEKLVYVVNDEHGHQALGTIHIKVIPAPEPEILDIKVLGNPYVGETLTAEVTCENCEDSKLSYEWIINGLSAGSEESYVYQESDIGYNVRLKVTVEDDYHRKDEVVVVYEPKYVATILEGYDSFSVMFNDGTITSWGKINEGACYTYEAPLNEKERSMSMAVSDDIYAAVKSDGTVITWGNREPISDVLESQIGAESIYGNSIARDAFFVITKSDGTMVVVSSQFPNIIELTGVVKDVKFAAGSDTVFATIHTINNQVFIVSSVNSVGVVKVFDDVETVVGEGMGSIMQHLDGTLRTTSGRGELFNIDTTSKQLVDGVKTFHGGLAFFSDGSVVTNDAYFKPIINTNEFSFGVKKVANSFMNTRSTLSRDGELITTRRTIEPKYSISNVRDFVFGQGALYALTYDDRLYIMNQDISDGAILLKSDVKEVYRPKRRDYNIQPASDYGRILTVRNSDNSLETLILDAALNVDKRHEYGKINKKISKIVHSKSSSVMKFNDGELLLSESFDVCFNNDIKNSLRNSFTKEGLYF